MVGLRAFLRLYSTQLPITGWRGVPWLGIAIAITVALPQARALIAAGFAGGVIIAVFLISMRYRGGSGPRRGSPITLFPRPVNLAPTGA